MLEFSLRIKHHLSRIKHYFILWQALVVRGQNLNPAIGHQHGAANPVSQVTLAGLANSA